MSLIDPRLLRVAELQNQKIPSEGPKAIPLILDFTTNATQTLDLLLTEQQGFMSMVQTIYIDLSGATNDVSITLVGSGQIIKAKAGTQGYYPVLCPNPTQLVFTASATGDKDPIFLINVPIAGVVWTS